MNAVNPNNAHKYAIGRRVMNESEIGKPLEEI